MPITPLHFGVIAPVNRFSPWKVSSVSFILVNVWIDSGAILAWLQNQPLPSHAEGNHTLLGAFIISTIVGMVGVRSRKWLLGAYLGGMSHILLDALVHPELEIFKGETNPIYMGWLEPLSWVLMPLTAWFIVQCVSHSRSWIARINGALFRMRGSKPSP